MEAQILKTMMHKIRGRRRQGEFGGIDVGLQDSSQA